MSECPCVAVQTADFAALALALQQHIVHLAASIPQMIIYRHDHLTACIMTLISGMKRLTRGHLMEQQPLPVGMDLATLANEYDKVVRVAQVVLYMPLEVWKDIYDNILFTVVPGGAASRFVPEACRDEYVRMNSRQLTLNYPEVRARCTKALERIDAYLDTACHHTGNNEFVVVDMREPLDEFILRALAHSSNSIMTYLGYEQMWRPEHLNMAARLRNEYLLR